MCVPCELRSDGLLENLFLFSCLVVCCVFLLLLLLFDDLLKRNNRRRNAVAIARPAAVELSPTTPPITEVDPDEVKLEEEVDHLESEGEDGKKLSLFLYRDNFFEAAGNADENQDANNDVYDDNEDAAYAEVESQVVPALMSDADMLRRLTPNPPPLQPGTSSVLHVLVSRMQSGAVGAVVPVANGNKKAEKQQRRTIDLVADLDHADHGMCCARFTDNGRPCNQPHIAGQTHCHIHHELIRVQPRNVRCTFSDRVYNESCTNMSIEGLEAFDIPPCCSSHFKSRLIECENRLKVIEWLKEVRDRLQHSQSAHRIERARLLELERIAMQGHLHKRCKLDAPLPPKFHVAKKPALLQL